MGGEAASYEHTRGEAAKRDRALSLAPGSSCPRTPGSPSWPLGRFSLFCAFEAARYTASWRDKIIKFVKLLRIIQTPPPAK